MRNTILIIDDDKDFVEAISVLLNNSGYNTINAFEGTEGVQKVKSESPDLILLDMMMSYKTEGLDTAKIISEDAASKNIPIILITGAHKEINFPVELKPDPKNLPVRAIVEKPIKPEALLKLIEGHISKTGKRHREIIDEINTLAERWKGKKGSLVMILHEIQNHYGYVPRGISFELSRMLDVPLARIYEVITFYNYFKLDPPGKYTISLCMGTACYLKGANDILQEFKSILDIEEGQTTQDGLFHLQIVRCLGCCGLAPVVMINNKIHGKVKKEDVLNIISAYVKESAAETK
ncbi:MAG: NAD(P)H-dependent oxidoreductase subunit E [Candidatus Omnitrophica bacterium]|nr:NAD(P)H-dependent oxidoreductase subunit E [Candidatus Omnitrophota bacterium]